MATTSRRHFLQFLAASGVAISTPRLISDGWAQNHTPERFWVFVHAGGGWDPTLLCDPKGRATVDSPNPINTYLSSEIATFGKLQCAPVPGVKSFFGTYQNEILVINGIDCQTNGHDAGSRHTWSGHLGAGWPCLAALIAAQHGSKKPLAFLSNGGYDYTAGVAPLTRVGNVSTFQKLAQPERLSPEKAGLTYHTAATTQRIAAAQQARLAATMTRPAAPAARDAMATLYALRGGDNDLAKLVAALPKKLDNSANRLKKQAQIAIAGFKSGLTVSAQLAVGGFDTHGDHDARHQPRMEALLTGVDFLWQEAKSQGIAKKLVVVVGSDFGRTPRYNDGGGKDHWSVTSMLLMGAGIQGGRVIGGTTDRQKPLKVNAKTLEIDESGVRITPGAIHRSLRVHAGIAGSALEGRFPIAEKMLAIV